MSEMMYVFLCRLRNGALEGMGMKEDRTDEKLTSILLLFIFDHRHSTTPLHSKNNSNNFKREEDG